MRANILRLLSVFLLMLCIAAPAYAQQEHVDLTKIPPLPSFKDEISKAQWVAESEQYQETPLGDRYLAYKVRLPKKWRRETTASASYDKAIKDDSDDGLSQRILGEIAKYFGPTRLDSLSRFEIMAQDLEYEVTAKNWFMHEILARGYSLEGLEVYSDRRVEALYVVVEKDTAYVVRAVAEINGPRMVVASYYVPDTHWEAERAQQEWAIKSFEFISPEVTKIELTRTYAFLDLLTFEYPASWRLVAPNIYSVEGMEAKILSSLDDKTLNGEISITILSSEFENAIADEVSYIKTDLSARGLEVGELIEVLTPNYHFGPHVVYSHVEAYKAVDTNSHVLEHEFWLAIMEEARYYYVVSMITPGRNSEFYTWARNGEVFQTVIESIKP